MQQNGPGSAAWANPDQCSLCFLTLDHFSAKQINCLPKIITLKSSAFQNIQVRRKEQVVSTCLDNLQMNVESKDVSAVKLPGALLKSVVGIDKILRSLLSSDLLGSFLTALMRYVYLTAVG